MKKPRNYQLTKTPIYLMGIVLFVLGIIGYPKIVGANYSDIYREVIAQTGFLAIVLYLAFLNRKNPTINITISATRLWLVGLFVLGGLSFFWTDNIDFFISKYLLWISAAAVFFLSLNTESNTKNHIILARVLTFIAIFIAIIGLVQALTSVEIFMQSTPPAANFVNKNMAAQVIVIIFPMLFFLLFTDSSKTLKRLYPYAIALILAYLFHTQTRGAWLSILVELLVITAVILVYFKSLKRENSPQNLRPTISKIHILFSVILFLILVSVSKQGWLPFFDILSSKTESIIYDLQSFNENRVASRYLAWQAAISMIADAPFFGSGMGSFFHNLTSKPENYKIYAEIRAHNDILELAVELGLVGAILLLGFMASLASNLVQIFTKNSSKDILFYAFAGIALLGSAVNMQFSFPYQMPVPLVIFAIYVGFIVKKTDQYSITKQLIFKKATAARSWFLALLTGVFLFVVFVNIGWLKTISHVNDNIQTNKWSEIEQTFCHKTIVKSFYANATIYAAANLHYNSINFFNAFDKCLPRTWLYYNNVGKNLLQLGRLKEAVKTLEKAKQRHPKINYEQHINQYIAYLRLGENQQAHKVYRQLANKPIEDLITQPKKLKDLIIMSLNQKNEAEALKFYKLFRQNYRKNKKFEKDLKNYPDFVAKIKNLQFKEVARRRN